jgi:Tol biopolymer transport system component
MDIYVVDANGNAPQKRATDPAEDLWPYWSREGLWLYFSSSRRGAEIWKMPTKGGKEIQVTRDNGTDWPQESPDGKWLYYGKGRSRRRPGHLRTTLKADLSLSSRTRSLW